MYKGRRLGVWAIAAYWFARSAAVAIMLLKARTDPGFAPRAIKFANAFGPFMWVPRLDSELCLAIAPASVLVGIGTGIGILLYQKWALVIIAFDRVIPLIRFLVFLPLLLMFNKGALSSINDSPLKLLDITSTLLMAAYLLKSDVRPLFGLS
jgi:hypothetical protein